ncbi:MAG: GNAT family N-acetyltransferase [Cyclobacteriaceae bacterium]|nr:GNAT family N-acetyltransferase [Cyclobacteriaceae bacterium]
MNYLLHGQQSTRLNFRSVLESDYDAWLRFFQDPNTSLHWVEEKKSADDACRSWYLKQAWRYKNNMGGMNALIEKSKGQLIGHAGLLVQTVDEVTELEIGYSLLSEFWGMGYAIEAAEKCKNFAFENNLAESLISIISLTNLPSQNVALKNGMMIQKQTLYKGNQVYIFRINKEIRMV